MVSVPLWEGVTADDTDDYYWSICRMYVYSISIFLKKIIASLWMKTQIMGQNSLSSYTNCVIQMINLWALSFQEILCSL